MKRREPLGPSQGLARLPKGSQCTASFCEARGADRKALPKGPRKPLAPPALHLRWGERKRNAGASRASKQQGQRSVGYFFSRSFRGASGASEPEFSDERRSSIWIPDRASRRVRNDVRPRSSRLRNVRALHDRLPFLVIRRHQLPTATAKRLRGSQDSRSLHLKMGVRFLLRRSARTESLRSLQRSLTTGCPRLVRVVVLVSMNSRRRARMAGRHLR